MTPEQREAVIAEAKTWLGTPYHHMADLKSIGVDCIMLLVRCFGAAGMIPEIDPRPYVPDWHLHHSDELYLGGLEQFADEVTKTPEPGDVGVWKFGRCYSHGGLFIESDLVLHAYVQLGVIMTRLTEEPLIHRNFRLYRVKN